MHDNQMAAGLVGLLLMAIAVLTPVAGAVMAALAIRRRGRNARLAMVGCLVMLPGPVVSTLGMLVGLGPLMDALGPYMAPHVIAAMALPFHLVGFGLVLAGALSDPKQPSTPSLPPPPLAPAPSVDARAH
ncbi:hypothetical protein ACFCV9_15360 [Streptomyces sp. NPDC056367]|uniref:hypothetical protein n=1 Tax=unclassified Streptomyces TaxID=2593676 RepID=UPI0035D60604